MTPPDGESRYRRVTVNGTELAYLELGSPSSPPLILCHGHISDLRSFSPIQDLLSLHFHLVIYSRRYAWPNTPIANHQPDDWHAHAEDLAAMITTLNISPTHILGNSSGGVIALLLAHSHPSLVSSLILIEPSLPTIFLPRLPPPPLDILRFLVRHPLCFLPITIFGATVIGSVEAACKDSPPDHEKALLIFGPGAISQASWSKLSPERMQQVHDNKLYLFHLFAHSTIPTIPEGKMRKMDVPGLMITGSETISAQKCIDWKVASVLPNCTEVVIEGASHFTHEDKPGKVVEAVLEFVKGLEQEN